MVKETFIISKNIEQQCASASNEGATCCRYQDPLLNSPAARRIATFQRRSSSLFMIQNALLQVSSSRIF